MEPTFKLIEVEDWDTSDLVELKPFIVETYYRATSKDGFNTQEEAEQEALKRMQRNPWGTEMYIMEVKKYMKAIPEGNVQFKTIDIPSYMAQKNAQEIQDDSRVE